MSSLPWFFFVLTAVPVLGIPAVTLTVIHRGALANGAARRTAVATTSISAVFAGAWMAVVWWAAASGTLARATVLLPIAVGVWLVAVLAWSLTPGVKTALRAPGATSFLIAPQTLRLAGVIFLLAMVLGRLPWLFALPAGIGDIAVGVAAPFVSRRVARGAIRGVIWFNVLGLLDLVVALALGALTGLSEAARLIPTTPSSAELTLLPLVLIPTTAVPLAIALHIVDLGAFSRLMRGRAAELGRDPVVQYE